jgi:hypothetical protein
MKPRTIPAKAYDNQHNPLGVKLIKPNLKRFYNPKP